MSQGCAVKTQLRPPKKNSFKIRKKTTVSSSVLLITVFRVTWNVLEHKWSNKLYEWVLSNLHSVPLWRPHHCGIDFLNISLISHSLDFFFFQLLLVCWFILIWLGVAFSIFSFRVQVSIVSVFSSDCICFLCTGILHKNTYLPFFYLILHLTKCMFMC